MRERHLTPFRVSASGLALTALVVVVPAITVAFGPGGQSPAATAEKTPSWVNLNSPWCNSVCIRAALHPVWLRCSSLK